VIAATAGLLAAAGTFKTPNFDYHALAPELVLTGVLVVLLLVDLVVDETRKYLVTQLAGLGLLASLIPIVTLAVSGPDRAMFGGAYVVDDFALVLKALFIVSGYVVLLMSSDYISEGDFWEGEYSFLLVSSILGMVVISSSRDLISIFVALELLSIPAYMLAGWRKRDLRSNEASMKYYLLGVLTSGVMLYGMSLIYGVTGSTLLRAIEPAIAGSAGAKPVVAIGIFFVVVAFAFKVSAVPFHFWAPDTYEGAPTPITAFLSVASKAAGFVAIMELVFIGFRGRDDVWAPMFWVLAALTMTVGNLVALRQTNIVRLLAYSSVAQAGYILVPMAVVGSNQSALKSGQTAIVVYLFIYAAMNLGAFAVVMAVSRKTRSGDIASWGGLGEYAPGLALAMSGFLFALAGIPPLGGWFAKFYVFRAALDAGGWAGVSLAVVAGLNSVIALFYYANIAREMWMSPVPDDDRTPVRVPAALVVSMGICLVVVVAMGIDGQPFARLGELASLVR
jgi:NADH-quinone oxidoreductase subunit N